MDNYMSNILKLGKMNMVFIKAIIFLLLVKHPFYTTSSFSFEEITTLKDSLRMSFTGDAQIFPSELPSIGQENSESTKENKERHKKISLLRLTNTKQIKISDDETEVYLSQIKKSIKKCSEKKYEHLSKVIIYSYPFFTNEETLFKFLITQKDVYPSFIIIFLRQFALEAMPNGLENFCAVNKTFSDLKDGLLDDPLFSCLIQNQLKCSRLDISKLSKLQTRTPEVEWFKRWRIEHFIEVLTQRDINLYCSITFEDVKFNIKNQLSPPTSIFSVVDHFNRTVNWICFEILKRKDQRERTKMVQLFRVIGRMLYNNKNFHGASQVALAFSKMDLNRILSSQEEKELMDEEFMIDINPNGNYKNYRELLSYPNCKSFEIPILPVFFKDILYAYETKSIETLSHLMEIFNRSKTFLHPRTQFEKNDRDALKFVSQFPDIDDTVLYEMSNLIKKWEFPRTVLLPQHLEDWNLSHFYTFLEERNEQLAMYDLFSRNIYSGQNFITYLKKCSSFEEADYKINKVGFTIRFREYFPAEIQKKLSDFSDLPILSLSTIRDEIQNSERTLPIKSKSYKRQSNTISKGKKIPEKKRLSLDIEKVNIDPIFISSRRTVRYKKEDTFNLSENQPILSFSKELTFWDVYFVYIKNRTGIYQWGRMEGPLLSTIKTIANQWRPIAPVNESIFSLNLFLLKRSVISEINNYDSDKLVKKMVKVDYSLPVSFPSFKSDNILTIYFDASEDECMKTMKDHEETPIDFIKRLKLWENSDGKILKDVLKKLESKKMMAQTLQKTSRQKFIETSDLSPPKKLINVTAKSQTLSYNRP